MNLDSLYYFSELCKDMHITRTANRLFLSQQTLSNHLARLEEECGTPLLTRKPHLALTDAGEEVLRFARLVCHEQTNLKDVLAEIEKQERGVLRFGASPLRMNACMPAILPAFSARYPRVELRLTSLLSTDLVPLVLNGDLDFATVLSPEPDPLLIFEKLMDDPVYLCVSNELLEKYYGDEADHLKREGVRGADMKYYSRLPLSLSDNRFGQTIAKSLEASGIHPVIYAMSYDTNLSLALCYESLAACFANHMRLATQIHAIPENINIFPSYDKGEKLTNALYLIRRKDRFLPHFAQLFLTLLRSYFADIQQIRIERRA